MFFAIFTQYATITQVFTPAIDVDRPLETNVIKLQPTFLHNYSSASSSPTACFGSLSEAVHVAQLPTCGSQFSVLKTFTLQSRVLALAAHSTIPLVICGTEQNTLELLHINRPG